MVAIVLIWISWLFIPSKKLWRVSCLPCTESIPLYFYYTLLLLNISGVALRINDFIGDRKNAGSGKYGDCKNTCDSWKMGDPMTCPRGKEMESPLMTHGSAHSYLRAFCGNEKRESPKNNMVSFARKFLLQRNKCWVILFFESQNILSDMRTSFGNTLVGPRDFCRS